MKISFFKQYKEIFNLNKYVYIFTKLSKLSIDNTEIQDKIYNKIKKIRNKIYYIGNRYLNQAVLNYYYRNRNILDNVDIENENFDNDSIEEYIKHLDSDSDNDSYYSDTDIYYNDYYDDNVVITDFNVYQINSMIQNEFNFSIMLSRHIDISCNESSINYNNLFMYSTKHDFIIIKINRYLDVFINITEDEKNKVINILNNKKINYSFVNFNIFYKKISFLNMLKDKSQIKNYKKLYQFINTLNNDFIINSKQIFSKEYYDSPPEFIYLFDNFKIPQNPFDNKLNYNIKFYTLRSNINR